VAGRLGHLRRAADLVEYGDSETGEKPMARVVLRWLAAGVTLMQVVAVSTALAQTPDADDVAEGMRLYRTKGDCQSCHGWAADGRKMDTQMPDGANLRTTRLSRELLLVAIKCGRPGKGMPAFDRLAYSDGRCYNMKAADLKSKGLEMPDPPATLQVREMERILDFLQVKVVGQGPMTRAKCVEYWGSDVDVCKDLPQ
jgi:mono/diheme cytochrome c family protein